MKRHIIIALSAAMFLGTGIAAAQGSKIKLTDEQILGKLPEGIINRIQPASKPAAVAREEAMPQLVDGWENPTYSPDMKRIAYTKNGNLYSINVESKVIQQHTFDGNDLILNGYASWVYYEEILGRSSRYKAFWWSPDSKTIAFYHFDNTNVPMFPIYLSPGQHGKLNNTRYPKAGDPNPPVKIGFVSIEGTDIVWADFNERVDQYFGIPFWNNEGTRFIVTWMDRSQDNFRIYSVDPKLGSRKEIFSEHQDTWIDWPSQMLFTKDGFYFIRDFEMWEQIYFLSYDGKTLLKITDGKNNWGINMLKVDKKYLFYTAFRETSTRTDIYRVDLRNYQTERVSYGDYSFSGVQISEDNNTITAMASNAKTPNFQVEIKLPGGNVKMKKVTVLQDSKGPDFDKYAIAMPDIVYVTMRDGSQLPAAVTYPIDMDTTGTVKYPVIVNIYGGPLSQQVYDTFKGVSANTQWWANHGVIQITLDTRSAGHLGKKGANTIYRYLSVHELEDFIDGISYFRAKPYVNCDKIGITGFSYGGTMTTLAVTEGNEYFKYGIAGAGVMDWKLYDTHYTERYMDTPQDNPDGYEKTAVIGRIGNYKGDNTNFLRLTHGTGDDNVHFQNSLQLINELENQGKDFELMIYPEGMHGYRGAQYTHFQMQNYKFWYKYLLDSELPDILKINN